MWRSDTVSPGRHLRSNDMVADAVASHEHPKKGWSCFLPDATAWPAYTNRAKSSMAVICSFNAAWDGNSLDAKEEGETRCLSALYYILEVLEQHQPQNYSALAAQSKV